MKRLPIKTRCVHCGYGPLDGALDATGRDDPPIPGDISLCFKCGGVGVYEATDGGLAVRRITAKELAELKEDAQTWETVQATRKKIRGRKP